MLIRISSDNKISVHEFSKETVREDVRKLIGGRCSLFEHVRPIGISEVFHQAGVCMLVDEDGYLKELDVNPFATFLYRNAIIKGNIVLAGEIYVDGCLEYCALDGNRAEKLIEEFMIYFPGMFTRENLIF